MLIVKQGILYDHITERWLKLIYIKKYILYKISVPDKVWYNFMGVKVLQIQKKGHFVHLKGWIQESLVG